MFWAHVTNHEWGALKVVFDPIWMTLRASAHTTLQRLEDVTDENNTYTFNLFPHCTWDEDEIVDPLVDPSLFEMHNRFNRSFTRWRFVLSWRALILKANDWSIEMHPCWWVSVSCSWRWPLQRRSSSFTWARSSPLGPQTKWPWWVWGWLEWLPPSASSSRSVSHCTSSTAITEHQVRHVITCWRQLSCFAIKCFKMY